MHQQEIAPGWQGPNSGIAGQLLDQTTIDSDTGIADFIRNNCGTICHPVGTAKMAPDSDKGTVVDQFRRVRGASNAGPRGAALQRLR